MNYALVENGVVTNVIWLHPNNASDFPNAVFTGDLCVGIGDTYEDGVFYNNGEKVTKLMERSQADQEDMARALALLGVETEVV